MPQGAADRLSDPVVLVTGGGAGPAPTMVRWFDTVPAAARQQACLEATARGVRAPGLLTDVPAGWVDAARRAHERLQREPYADLTGLATHRPRPGTGGAGPLEPVPVVRED